MSGDDDGTGGFQLDSRLKQDTHFLAASDLSVLLLMNDQRYPWCILVPKQPRLVELFDLSDTDQTNLWQETMLVGEQLKQLFNADKINIANLGNVVSQLHVHIIARFRQDPAWPGPVWGHSTAEPHDETTLTGIRAKLKASDLSRLFQFDQ